LSAPRKSICAHFKHFDPDLEEADKVSAGEQLGGLERPIGSRIIFSGERRGAGLNLNAAFSARDDQRRSTCPIEQDRRLNNVDVSLESVRQISIGRR
jgi:hypothetical protein